MLQQRSWVEPHPFSNRRAPQPSTPLMLLLRQATQGLQNLLCVLRPCLELPCFLSWPLWLIRSSEDRTECVSLRWATRTLRWAKSRQGAGKEQKFSYNQLVRTSQIRCSAMRPILLLWSPCFSYLHFIFTTHTLQSLTSLLKIRTPILNFIHAEYRHNIDKCPWTSKYNTIYTAQFFEQSSTSHCQMLYSSSERSKVKPYFSSEPLFIEWKWRGGGKSLTLLFNNKDFLNADEWITFAMIGCLSFLV